MADLGIDLTHVKGIFFDYGGVIEDLCHDEEFFQKGIHIIEDLLKNTGIDLSRKELAESISSGQEAYNVWYRKNNYRELPNGRIWTSFFLPHWCRDSRVHDNVESLGEDLSRIYEYYLYRRRPARAMVDVLRTLLHHRYTLALVSNTMSRNLIPERLRRFSVHRYFTSVVLSMSTGWRKPGGEIFRLALMQTGLTADSCMFVGDTLSRDVEGSKRAGFYRSVLIHSGLTEEKDRGYEGGAVPDYTLQDLSELTDGLPRME